MYDDYAIPKIIAAIIGFFALMVFLSMCSLQTRADYSSEYNDGIHQDCGGHLVYQQAIGHKDSTAYIFRCDKCNELFEINSSNTNGKVIYFSDGETRPSETIETWEEVPTTTEEQYMGNESMNANEEI